MEENYEIGPKPKKTTRFYENESTKYIEVKVRNHEPKFLHKSHPPQHFLKTTLLRQDEL
jgi:hypothetical protein